MNAINRKQQIERDFLRRVVKALRGNGCQVTPTLRASLKSALRSAAMVGACEERHRTLRFLDRVSSTFGSIEIRQFIVSRGVLEVLGYDNEQGGKEI